MKEILFTQNVIPWTNALYVEKRMLKLKMVCAQIAIKMKFLKGGAVMSSENEKALTHVFEYGLEQAKWAVQMYLTSLDDYALQTLIYPIQKAIAKKERKISKCFSGRNVCLCPVCFLDAKDKAKDKRIKDLENLTHFGYSKVPELEKKIKELESKLAKAVEALEKIADVLGIGKEARKDTSIIIVNIKNATRRSACLWEIEKLFTKKVIDEDGEEMEERLLNWGSSPENYLKQFKKALKEIKGA